ncbi:hypothetical protein ARTHRO9V_1270003 [Arthrobacter sp. 9V]|uniref:hypothetical protein n=1 Tax=Arthrobacter sp. 9V TaxID=2653132 RepID=UPI0012F2CB0F|nr:hypothetical protein [Arthrobacter sp. 9V]VXB16531.1 hypothetical protein ARTHRO9V_1270003 [Arthrobacter sp. 9V]
MTESPETRQTAEEIEWFPARDLVDAMKAEGLELHVEQTGGGTATFFLQSEGNHTFTVGPGSFNWKNPPWIPSSPPLSSTTARTTTTTTNRWSSPPMKRKPLRREHR